MARRYHGDKEDGTARRIEVWHRLSYSLPAVGLLMPTIGNVVHRASVGMFNFRNDYQPCFLEGLFECSAAPPLPNNGVDQQITFTDRGNNLDANVAQRRPNCPCCSGHHDFTPPDQPPYTTLPDEFFGEQSSHNGRTAYQPPPAKMPADGFKMEAVKLSIEKCGETSVTLKWRATKLDAESYFMEMTNSLEAFKTAHLVFNGPPPGLRSSGCYHYCVPGLVSGVDYRFRVKYSCILGESPQSPWISAKTQGTIPSKYTRRRKVTHPAVPDNKELEQKELKTKKLQKRAENRAKEKERRRKNKSKAKPPKLKKEKPTKPKKPEEKKEISEPPSETLVTNTKQVTVKQKQTSQEPAQSDAPKGKKKKRRKKKNQDWAKKKMEELTRYESILKEKNKQTTHDDVIEMRAHSETKSIPVVPPEDEESDEDDDDDNSENADISGEEESSSSEDEDEQDDSDDSDSHGGSREAKSSSRQDDGLSTSSSSESPDDTPLDLPQRSDTVSVSGSIDEDNGKGRKRRPRRRKKKKDKRQQTPHSTVQTTPPKKSSSHEARRPPIHRHHDRMDERSSIPFPDSQKVHPYNSARYSTRQRIGNGDRKPIYAPTRREEMYGGQRLPPNIHRTRQGPPDRGYPPIIEQRRAVSDPLPPQKVPLSQNAAVFKPTHHVATSFYDPLKQTVSPDLNYVSSQHLTQPRPASTDTMGQPMYFSPMMQNRFLGEVIPPQFPAPHIQPHVAADTPDFLPVGPHGPITPFSPYADPYPEQPPLYDFAPSKASDELDQNVGVADTVSSNLGGRSNEPSSTQNRTPTTGSDSEPFSPLDRNDPSYFLPSGIIEPDDGKNATYQDDMDAPVDSELASASVYSGGSMWLQQPSESWGNLPPEYERADEKDLRPPQPSNSTPVNDDEAPQEDYPFRPSPSASDTPCEDGRLSPPPSLWWERQKPTQDSE